MTKESKEVLMYLMIPLIVWVIMGFIVANWNVFSWEAYVRGFLIAFSAIGFIVKFMWGLDNKE